jgi:hypothetical protein
MAGAVLQALPGAQPVLSKHGATRFELYRKDRVQCQNGREHLHEYRLTEFSKTRRVVATCCNTSVFLEFSNGHWLSLYGGLWPETSLPALEMRTMTRDRPQGVELPNDVPNAKTHTLSFMAKLLMAWAAMRFRTPQIDYVKGRIDT